MLAFDCSNYTGKFTLDEAFRAREAGFTRAIVQIIDPPSAYPASAWREQIGACAAVGLEVQAYTYLYLRSDPAGRVGWVLQQLGMCPGVQKLWLDVEDTEDGVLSVNEREWSLWYAMQVARVAGVDVGLYTGKWWWDRYMPGVTWPSYYMDLWAADYDNQQSLDTPLFGGWSEAKMKQYAGTSQIAGPIHQVDLNYYEQ